MNVQAFVALRTVERLDERVVRRLARSREVNARSVMISPQIDQMAGKLRSIVGK
jgi:hypothetical protein